MARAVCV
jgi:alpha-N-acetylglucosaminidase